MNTRFRNDALVFILLVVVGAATRLGPYYLGLKNWNFNPIGAFALFAGFYFVSRSAALAVPFFAMAISDVLIGRIMGKYDWPMMLSVYVMSLLPVVLGPWLRAKFTAVNIGVGAVASALAFYVVTNAAFAYCFKPHTLVGLKEAYIEALPFLKGTLAGNLVFAAITFGLYALLKQRSAESELVANAEAA